MTKKKVVRPRGRPPTGHDPIRGVRMSDALVAKIDKWRMIRLDKPKLTTSSAMRELVLLALVAEGVVEKDDELCQAS